MKAIPCTVICNTTYGYCMTPKKCKSIREALAYARDMAMPYRIYANGKLVRRGWFV